MNKETSTITVVHNGSTCEVNILCEFSEKIGTQKFSFIIHRTLSVCRYALVEKSTAQRLALLDTGHIATLGMESAGRTALSRLMTSLGESRLAGILTGSLHDGRMVSE